MISTAQKQTFSCMHLISKIAKSRLTNQQVSYREALADFQIEQQKSFAEQLKDLNWVVYSFSR